MKNLQERLSVVEKHVKNDNITIMILGLGSVGSYLLDYILSRNDRGIKVVVVGRNQEKLEMQTNIIRVSALIREVNKTHVVIESGIDFDDTSAMAMCFKKHKPDFIVNSSRAYPGLKYGTISWKNLRAYGIWSPLAIKLTKNIMEACQLADVNAVVINTSYSDAVIPWLRSAGKAYPDFGSGNFNHLIPRLKFAVAQKLNVEDFWNVDIAYATSHFHDVCISKEGHNENVEQLLKIFYQGRKVDISQSEILSMCKILMPTDATRNMMNASSNYRIIFAIVDAIRNGTTERIYSPGVFGEIGGYPVIIKYNSQNKLEIEIDQSEFTLQEMREANRRSIALDGIEDIKQGSLVYTDELIDKCQLAFGVSLPKKVDYMEIDEVATWLIKNIIEKASL